MKKITILFTCYLLLFTLVKAQTPPNAFNYSAIARDLSGQPIVSTTIGIQITILKTSPTGASQYSENHFVNTDAYGLFNLVIGAGAVQSGSMESIDWSNDNYYLKVGMDVTGGSNFLTMGTTQFLSVPYAIHAKTAESIVGGAPGGCFTHYIGEILGGGVIFHLWKDAQGVEHGLIVDITDLSMEHIWSNVNQTLIGPPAQSTWDGLSNSIAIVNQPGHTKSAASLCLNSTNGGYSDWYLPSIDELSLLWHSRFNVNKTLSTIVEATVFPALIWYGSYHCWSSTESHDGEAFALDLANGTPIYYSAANVKAMLGYVRAIRAF